jgi:hypothetical protein
VTSSWETTKPKLVAAMIQLSCFADVEVIRSDASRRDAHGRMKFGYRPAGWGKAVMRGARSPKIARAA